MRQLAKLLGFVILAAILATAIYVNTRDTSAAEHVVDTPAASAWREARTDINRAEAVVVAAREASSDLADAGVDTAALDAAISDALSDLPDVQQLGTQAQASDAAIDSFTERSGRALAIIAAIDQAAAAVAASFTSRAAALNTEAVITAAREANADPRVDTLTVYLDAETQARLDVRRNQGLPISTVGGAGDAVVFTESPELLQPVAVAGEPAPIDLTRYVDESSSNYVPAASCANKQPWLKVDPGPGHVTDAGKSFSFPWTYEVELDGQGFVHFYVCS